MANRTVNSPFDTVGSKKWYNDLKDMATPGTYERGIFGDLMLPGIACGVKKILFIFNTSLNSPHDPISIVDPNDFDVKPDTETPIILACNMSHYESMEPCTNQDIEASVDLVKSYQIGRYQYSRPDLPFLLRIQSKEDDNDLEEFVRSCSKQTIPLNEKSSNLQSKCQMSSESYMSSKPPFITLDGKYNQVNHGTFSDVHLSYKWIGSKEEKFFEEKDGKFNCPICNIVAKNMQLHFHKNFCINKIDIDHFEAGFELYQKSRLQKKNKEKKDRWKNDNPELYKERKQIYAQAYKSKHPEEFRRKNLQDVNRHQNKLIEENPTDFKKTLCDNKKKSWKKDKEKNPDTHN